MAYNIHTTRGPYNIYTTRGPKEMSEVVCDEDGCGWGGTELDDGRHHVATTGHTVQATEWQTFRIVAWNRPA